jgi:hypothetical protein
MSLCVLKRGFSSDVIQIVGHPCVGPRPGARKKFYGGGTIIPLLLEQMEIGGMVFSFSTPIT